MGGHHSVSEQGTAPMRNEMAAAALYTLGTTVYGPYPVPEGATSVRYEIDRTAPTWEVLPTSTRAARLSAELSYDNGSTWAFAAAVEANGGVHVLRSGATATKTTLTFSVDQPTLVNRLYRVTVILDSNVVTGCHAQWE